jgi:hypothetical protein
LPGFNAITFTFSDNSNYWWKSLLEVIRQTFCFQKFFDNTQQCFAFSENSNYGKAFLRGKGKTLLSVVNKLLKTNSLLTSPSNVCLITSSKFSQQYVI